DHHVLRLLKKWRQPFDDADFHFEPSREHLRRSQSVFGYVKMLGGQQLITGFAILIVGLASRCQITSNEFNVVTSLAYFAMYVHILSWHVVR
ncbi:hypothetical protein EK21DRAFT_41030, partial [Setomelanomma holmii]